MTRGTATRPLLLGLAVIVVVALTLIAGAPARAAETPRAVDFEQRIGDVQQVATGTARQRGAADPVRWRTAAIAAPKRFDLVGIAGETRPLDYRVRSLGGPWSEWVTVSDGNPLYGGGSDEVQIRSRGPRIAGTLHYVNVSGTATPAQAVRTGLGELTRSTGLTARGSDSDAGLAPKPHFVTRRQWGANKRRGGCHPRVRPDYGRVKAAAVHHTVSANDYSEGEAPGIVLGICRFHRNGNGWNDIGYNALVDRFGNIYQGRAGGMKRPVVGAQAEGYNSLTTGVALIGTYTDERPSRQARRGLVHYLAWKLGVHEINPTGKTHLRSAGGGTNRYPDGTRVVVKRIFGHRDTNYTECPGRKLKRELPKLRRKVERRMESFAGSGRG